MEATTDPHTVTVHVTDSVADALLKRVGITGNWREGFTLPGRTPRAAGGLFGTDYLWERDDALTQALVILAS